MELLTLVTVIPACFALSLGLQFGALKPIPWGTPVQAWMNTLGPDKANDSAIQKMANVHLELRNELAPQAAAIRVLNVPRAQLSDQRKRLEKEHEQFEKNIAKIHRQLADGKFLSRAPAHVVEGLRTKLTEYETHLPKIRKALDGLYA